MPLSEETVGGYLSSDCYSHEEGGNNPVVTYETDGGKVLCQRTRIGTNDIYVFFFYDASGNAYAMEYDGDMYYYLRNGQNDVIGIIDDTGAVVARYTYDPWGKPLTVKDGAGVDIAANATHVANVNPFRYRGYFYDVETGVNYLFHTSGYAGGLTPLLDRDGKPVISSKLNG